MTSDAALTADFLRYERLIRHTAALFAGRYGGDVDDYFSDGQLLFLQVHEKFDPSRGAKFSTWFRKILWNRFYSRRRTELRRSPNGEREPEELLADHRQRLPRRRWNKLLSDAALEIVDLVYWPPPDIGPELCKAKHSPGSYRRQIYNLLRGLGWTRREIHAAFEEIADALRDSI